MNTLINDLFYTYAHQQLPEPSQWHNHEAYDCLYARLSPEGRAQLSEIIAAARAESLSTGERAFTSGLELAISLFIGVFAEY